MAGTIYLVTNTLNGKQYVGQTIVAGNRVGHGKLMTRAYKKHGKDSFEYMPVCNGIENRNTLNFMEKFWIKVMDCRIPNGYNIEHGGSKVEKIADETRAILSAKSKGNQRRLGTKQSEATRALMSAQRQNMSAQTRQRLSESRKKWSFSEETKAKIGAAHKGRIVTAETRAKLSAINKGKTFSMETKQKLSEAAKLQWARQKGEI